MQDAYISAKGDFTAGTFAPAQTTQMRAFLSGVEVQAANAQAVVVFGDSISDEWALPRARIAAGRICSRSA